MLEIRAILGEEAPGNATRLRGPCLLTGPSEAFQGPLRRKRQLGKTPFSVIELLQQHLAQGPLRFMDILPEIHTTSVNYIYPDSWSELTERVIWRWDVFVSQGDWLDSFFSFTFDGHLTVSNLDCLSDSECTFRFGWGCALERNGKKRPLNSGLGIIVILPPTQ